jgi:hypothetical protein
MRDLKRTRKAEWAAGVRRDLWRAGADPTPDEMARVAAAWGEHMDAITAACEGTEDPGIYATPTRLGRLLASAAADCGDEHNEIAARAGVDQRTLRRYLAGDSMDTLRKAQAIATACGFRLVVRLEGLP